MEEKKNKGYIITIIILAVMLVGSIGYIFYSNIVANNDTEKKQDNTNNENVVDKNSSRELTELEKATIKDNIENFYNIYLSEYYPIDDITDLKSIDNQKLLGIALYNAEEKTVDNINSYITKYFGNTVTLKHEDYVCPNDNKILYKYDDVNKIYTLSTDHPGHGFVDYVIDSKSLIIDGNYENEIYTVKVKNLYASAYGDTYGPIDAYYSSLSDSKNKQNPIIKIDIEDENFVLTDDIIKTYSDKLPTTTYKFKLNSDGQFYLISVN